MPGWGQLVKRPARHRPHGAVVPLAGQEPLSSHIRDHGAVVGAETPAGIEGLGAPLVGFHGQTLAKPGIGADATRHHQALQAGGIQGAPALDHQRIDHGFLEGSGDIGAGLVIEFVGFLE